MWKSAGAITIACFLAACGSSPPFVSLPPMPPIHEGSDPDRPRDGSPGALRDVYAFTPITGTQTDSALLPGPGVAHFINVGQADATLLEFACGVVLIDAGGDDGGDVDRLIQYLEAVFARRPDLNRTIDLLILTHTHIDHTRAFDALLERFTIKQYVDNGRTTGSGISQVKRLKEAAPRKRIALREVADAEIAALPHHRGLTGPEIDPIGCDACDPRISILSARKDEKPTSGGWSAIDYIDQNNHSLVIRVDFGEASFLFTGDLETPGIETLLDRYRGTDALDVDVYHAGHHGAPNGTTPELAAAMSPQIMIISCGDSAATVDPISAFTYGNPRKQVIDILSANLSRDRAAPGMFPVATGAWRFSDHPIQRAIYATCWDGHIALIVHPDGAFRVLRHHSP